MFFVAWGWETEAPGTTPEPVTFKPGPRIQQLEEKRDNQARKLPDLAVGEAMRRKDQQQVLGTVNDHCAVTGSHLQRALGVSRKRRRVFR